MLERADRSGERYTLVPDRQKLKGVFYDFAANDRSLVAGLKERDSRAVQPAE